MCVYSKGQEGWCGRGCTKLHCDVLHSLYLSANSVTVTQPRGRDVLGTERTFERREALQNIEIIMAICVNIRVLLCVPTCGLVERYRVISFLRSLGVVRSELTFQYTETCKKIVTKILNTI
jgi:hypothetical protein